MINCFLLCLERKKNQMFSDMGVESGGEPSGAGRAVLVKRFSATGRRSDNRHQST